MIIMVDEKVPSVFELKFVHIIGEVFSLCTTTC